MQRSSDPDPQALTRGRRVAAPFGILAILSVAVATVLSGCGNDHEATARVAFEKRDYKSAAEEFQWALNKDPGNASLEYSLAICLARSNQKAEAIQHLEKLTRDPVWRERALQNLAQVYADQGNFALAFKTIDELIAAHPDRGELFETRGQLWSKQALAHQEKFREWGKQAIDGTDVKPIVDFFWRSRVRPAAFVEAEVKKKIEQLMKDRYLETPAGFREHAVILQESTAKMEADFKEASAKSPTAFRANFELGMLAIERIDVDEAIRSMKKVIDLDDATLADKPARVAFNDFRGRALDLLTGFLERQEKFKEALAILEPEFTSGWIAGNEPLMERLARLYLAKGDVAAASKIADAVLVDNVRSAWGNYIRGQILMREKQPEQALAYLERAHVSARTNADISKALGLCYVALKNDASASDQFRLALAGLPKDVDLAIEYGRLLSRYGDPKIARDFIEDTLRRSFQSPASPEHQKLLAEAKAFYNDSAAGVKTIADAKRMLKVDSLNPYLKLALAKLEHESGASSVALPRCLEVSRQFPGIGEAWALAAKIATDLGRWDDAAKYLRQARILNPTDPNLPWTEALALRKQNRLFEAKAAVTKALEIDRTIPGARLLLLELTVELREWTEARRIAEDLAKEFPEDPRVLRSLGRARLGSGDAAGALDCLRRVEAQLPEDLDVRFAVGEALSTSPNPAEGVERLISVAKDPKSNPKLRRSAAEALNRVKAFREAAAAFEAAAASTKDEAERVEMHVAVFLNRLWSGDIVGALDHLVAMKAAGRDAAVRRQMTMIGRRWGYMPAAAEAADAVRKAGEHDQWTLEAAAAAHLATEQWVKALEDLDDLERVKGISEGQIAFLRAKARIGLGKTVEAAALLETAAEKLTGDEKATALELALSLKAATHDIAGTGNILKPLLSLSPMNARGRLIAAESAIDGGSAKDGVEILIIAPMQAWADGKNGVAAAALLALGGDPGSAAKILKGTSWTPSTPEVQGLVGAVAMRADAQKGTFAAVCAALIARNFTDAHQAVAALELPITVRDHLDGIVSLAERKPEDAGLMAHDLALVRLSVVTGLAPSQGLAMIGRMRERAADSAKAFDVLRAWTLLELGRPAQAADAVRGLLEGSGRDPLVVYTAAVATLDANGLSNAAKFITTLDGAPPPSALSDLAAALAARGHLVEAEQIVRMKPALEAHDFQLLVRLGLARHEPEAIAQAFGKLSPAAASAPDMAVASAWAKASRGTASVAAMAEAAAVVKDLLKNPRALDPPLDRDLFEAAVLSGLQNDARTLLDHGMKRAGFNAAEIAEWGASLRRIRRHPDWLAEVDARVAVLSPSGTLPVPKLRSVRPR